MFNFIGTINDWVAETLPGLKTKILAIGTALAGAGLLMTQMLSEVPVQWDLLIGKWAPYASMGVGFLTFWFRYLADRVKTAVN